MDVIVVTAPYVQGYRIRKVLGIVSGLTARTRGVGGKFIAGIESMVGGEVSAFSSEMEKARVEALERLKENARRMGANGVISVDVETSEIFQATVMISVTGTAVILEVDQVPPPASS